MRLAHGPSNLNDWRFSKIWLNSGAGPGKACQARWLLGGCKTSSVYGPRETALLRSPFGGRKAQEVAFPVPLDESRLLEARDVV